MRHATTLLILTTLALHAIAQEELEVNSDQRLADKLRPLVESHDGDIAVCIRQLSAPGEKKTQGSTFNSSENVFAYYEDEVMPTASLIKLAVMVTAYRMVDKGKVSLDQEIELTKEDKVPGSGILTRHFSAGTKLSLRDAIRLMIVYSDNTATNLVLDAIGLKSTADTMTSLGFPETKINSKVYKGSTTTVDPKRSKIYGLGSTSAVETINLLEQLHHGTIATSESCERMLSDLKACEGDDKIAAGLPRGVKFANKTGAISHARCDAGIVYGRSATYAVCVLTANNKDRSWDDSNSAQKLCAKIGRIAFEHFNPQWQSGTDPSGNLEVGSFGTMVEMLQRTLNERSLPSPELSIDGDFGPATETAVKMFQAANKLEASGLVDASTWKALGPLVGERRVRSPREINSEKLDRKPADSINGTPFVTCKSYMVLGEDGVLWDSKNKNLRLPNASTTKLMTAALVLRLANQNPSVLDEQITFSQRADQTRGSTAGVRVGESLSVRDCLYGLLLPSGNDASVALAEHFGQRVMNGEPDADPLELFVDEMNAHAIRLHKDSSAFRNPHGLDNDDHFMSASDLAHLAVHVWKNDFLRKIVGTRQHGVTLLGKGGYKRNVVWKNTNRLLEIEGYDGLKTGTTSNAGACLVSTAERDGHRLFVVVLGSASSDARYADTRNLYRHAWAKIGVKDSMTFENTDDSETSEFSSARGK